MDSMADMRMCSYMTCKSSATITNTAAAGSMGIAGAVKMCKLKHLIIEKQGHNTYPSAFAGHKFR